MSKQDTYTGVNGSATIVSRPRGKHGEPIWAIIHKCDGETHIIPGFTDWHCARSVAEGIVDMQPERSWDELAQDWCEDQASRR
jgi:hypothetical protein